MSRVSDDAWTSLVASGLDEDLLDAIKDIEARIKRSLTDEEQHTLAVRYAAKADAGQQVRRRGHIEVLNIPDLAEPRIPRTLAENAAAFVEGQHPRGQPENAGEFAAKGAGDVHLKDQRPKRPDDAWRKSLSKDELYAIKQYTGSVFGTINDILIGRYEGSTDENRAYHLENAQRIEAAIERHPKFAKPIKVWRRYSYGMDLAGVDEPDKELGKRLKYFEDNVGKVVRLKGFKSTTRDASFAARMGLGFVAEITTQHGAPLGDVSENPNEHEVLLGHDWGYLVTGVRNATVLDEGKAKHVRVVELTVVDARPPHPITPNAAAFVEQEHPRGKPENAGEFTKKGQSTKAPISGLEPKTATGKTMTRGGVAPIPAEHVEWLRGHGVKKFPAKDATGIEFHRHQDPLKGALMTWRDGAGRQQAAYAEKFIQASAEAKWQRIEQFEPAYDAIVSTVHEAMATSKPGSPEHQAAAVVAVIADTGLRPGSAGSVKEHKHYGVTTLEWRHVTLTPGKAVLLFTGKSGERNRAVITDPRILTALTALEAVNGDDERARVFPDADPDDIRHLLPEGMKVKDFRTIKAAKVARAELAKVRVKLPLGDPKESKRIIARVLLDVSKTVSKVLNNSPAMARSSYIPPAVFESWVRSVGGSHLMTPSKNSYDEVTHGEASANATPPHRGQPDNAGQFGPGGGSKAPAPVAAVAPNPASAPPAGGPSGTPAPVARHPLAPNPAEDVAAFQADPVIAAALDKAYKDNDGITLGPNLKPLDVKGGFIVTLTGLANPLSKGGIKKDHIQQVYETYQGALRAHPGSLTIGAFSDHTKDYMSADLNVILDDRDEAIRLGKATNQISIFDNTTYQCLPTNGDGKPRPLSTQGVLALISELKSVRKSPP